MKGPEPDRYRPRWLRVLIYLSRRLLAVLTWAYLLRFPLLTAAALVALPLAARFTGASSLLLNLFDLNWRRILVVSLAALLAAWSVMVTARLARLYGPRRFRVVPARISPALRWWQVFAYAMLALPLIIVAVTQSTDRWWLKLAGAGLGFVAAFALLCGAALAQKLAVRTDTALTSPDLLLPTRVPGWQWLFDRVSKRPPLLNPSPALAELLRRVPRDLGRGYIDYADRRGALPLLSGHVSAATLFLLFFGVYLLAGYLASPWRERSIGIPSLACVILLLTLLNWGFSGITFFLDRYRIPVLMTVGVWLLITAQFKGSDYYYPLLPLKAQTSEPIRPVAEKRKAIVVAASGGGIQAAAWTAQALAGLELQCRRELSDRPYEFGRNIRLISAVSGGSVGAMYFTGAYRAPAGLPDEATLQQTVEQAMSSSLDQVAWGLVYPDLMRSFFPFIWSTRATDRGHALEQAWQKTGGITDSLDVWRAGVSAGWRPATIFNATIVDTGERLLFSTSGLKVRSHGGRYFSDLFPQSDIPVTTAVRLSATFPFVTPAARADADAPRAAKYHVVDGGYYDNYGVASLVEWLDAALEDSGSGYTDVLVLLIRSFPSGAGGEPTDSRGWFYQSFAPFSTLLHVRNTGQSSHSEVELDLLLRALKTESRKIEVIPFEFEGDPPLSWHLTRAQQQSIRDEWQRELFDRKGADGRNKWDQVKDFLRR
ncbi:MAG TPA: patatin-like phospholipase family protein [Blastocatellia bacterium]|nr:patatin-like phospholipase family protein [Blastocatellia bacterium]